MNDILGQLPEAHSPTATNPDYIYHVWFWASVAFFVLLTAATVWFCWRYRRRPGVKAEPTGHNQVLELTWTFSPLIILVFFFHQGFRGYVYNATAPDNAIQIRVFASQWKWTFQQPNGVNEIGTLHVPVNHPVQLVMSSDDVIHSFFVPAFRVKKDVVPGVYSTLWFMPDRLSSEFPTQAEIMAQPGFFASRAIDTRDGYQVECAEYCGTSHSGMLAKIVVTTEAEYQHFLAEGPSCSGDECPHPEIWGRRIWEQAGCKTCHSIDGSAGPGPTWRGLFGSRRTMTDGSTHVVDENFVRQSIMQPQAEVDSQFTNVLMPTFQGQLYTHQVDAVIAFLKTLH